MNDPVNTPVLDIFKAHIVAMRLLLIATLLLVVIATAW
jgi:hypothetical protein